MINRLTILFCVVVMGLLLPTAVSRALFSVSSEGKVAVMDTAVVPDGSSVPDGTPLLTSWYGQYPDSIHQGAGIVSYYNLSVFGQNICTAFGDPYSPLNSPYAPGPYTYTYRIRIPADYPYNVVRLELFDPDSINADNPGKVTIPRTQAAIDAGLSPTTTGTCSSDRRDNCLMDTDELTLVDGGVLTLDQINPYWFWRVDENRGTGGAPGNGSCGTPTSYDAGYNTRTFFDLHYFAEQPDGSILRQDLARYTGQVGDGARDTGDHDTDRRWVSPGAAQSFDQPVFVPADAGSSGNFEVDLTTETPGIITDPASGDRYLYLGITGMDGASENGFDIWAGPPVYTATVPSDVNARNLEALNNPNIHSAEGVEVTALDNLLLNQNYDDPLDMPLVKLDAAYAGFSFQVTLFDSDSGAQPPISFTVDSIAASDWSLVFAQSGVPDPDGEVRNCLPGNCNNVFISPPYIISLPEETNCPFPPLCIPFYGGTFTARYEGGAGDTYLWRATLPTPPASDPTAGCSAYPIIIHEGNRSVTPPGTGGNPFPDPADFQNPNPPTYDQFINHVPNEPLIPGPNSVGAREGYLYLMENGFGNGNFGWLRWNEGQTANLFNLTGSMTWPGNSLDYTDHGNEPQGQPVPGSGYSWPVWGYIEPGDPTDQAMHIGDWAAANTGVANSAELQDLLNEHIALGRVLRLLIWDISTGSGNNGIYHISRFGLFRLQGYNLTDGWLLLEFMGWDESCGQTSVALDAVSISGPTSGLTNTTYAFTATVAPSYATTPITTVWQIDGQPTITHTGGITDVVNLSWPLTGTYTLTVTAVNPVSGPVTDTHTIVIQSSSPPEPTVRLYLPIILKP